MCHAGSGWAPYVKGGGSITSGGATVAPDASWRVVEIGDFNGDSNAAIQWRSDSGAMAEWLMNGTTVMQSLTPNSSGTAASPDASWSTQARPTNGQRCESRFADNAWPRASA